MPPSLGNGWAALSGSTSRERNRKLPGDELVKRPDVLALYQEIVDGLNRELSQFERIKRGAILPREFTIESGELTPSLKVKRKVVEEKWRAEIERIYGD